MAYRFYAIDQAQLGYSPFLPIRGDSKDVGCYLVQSYYYWGYWLLVLAGLQVLSLRIIMTYKFYAIDQAQLLVVAQSWL